jgi:signal peptide peptidase SppA
MRLLPHTAGRVFNTPLMVSRAKLDTILNVVVPRMEGESLPAAAAPETHDYDISKEGIAVIPVFGTLVRRTVGLEAQSGLTSYIALEEQLHAAMNDNSIKGILLDVDSPGGESGGVFDFADKIYAASRIKPIYAVINEDAFSAAYIIAAAAQRIYIPRTGGAGSIGVIAVHLDESKAEAEAGLTYTAIYAGARKNDLSPHEPLSDPARARLQAEVDRIYKIFSRSVSRFRGLDEEFVASTEAALYFGENAILAGLADQIGTFDDALNALARKISKPSSSRDIAEYPEDLEDDDIMTELFAALDEEEPRVSTNGRATPPTMNSQKEKNMAKTEKDDDVAARRSKKAKHRAEEHEDQEDDTHLEGEDGEEEEKDAPASRKSRKAKRHAVSEEEDGDDESHLETDDVEDEEEDAPTSRKSKKAKGRKAETDEEEDDDAYLELDDEDEEEAPASRRRAKAMSRKAKRKKAFTYLAAVNELCLLAGRPDKAAAFIAKAVPLSTIRKVLLNARAAQDEATAIMGYAAPRTTTAKDEPKIDTAAIYASRNNLKRSKN